jgi:hypothetical protein
MSIANRLSDLAMLVAALEEKGLRDDERIKDLLARLEKLDAARDATIARANRYEEALGAIRHIADNEIVLTQDEGTRKILTHLRNIAGETLRPEVK